jgi:hypothetical protein
LPTSQGDEGKRGITKRILRHRPSPATVIALAALVVAAAGVAYAAIPDSTGTIHACYQKRSGDLRVVESADDCRSRERALAWNQQGPAGAAVVARMKGGPFTFTDLSTQEIPLEGASWTQQAGEYQEVVGQIDVDFGCGREFGPGIRVFLDGTLREESLSSQGQGVFSASYAPVHDFRLALFEPDESTQHTLAIEVDGRCHLGGTTIKSIKVNVLGFR